MQVLTQELNRVNEEISQLSFYKDKLTTLIRANESVTTSGVTVTVESAPKSKKKKMPAINDHKFNLVAAFVAQTIRSTGCTKSEAISLAIEKYKLNPKRAHINLSQRMTPSQMGKEHFNKIFEGTKYVR